MTDVIDKTALLAAGIELLNREALYLDEQQWSQWLALYQEDCILWAPAWKTDIELTDDHIREISIFFFKSRAGLEDRVWRIESGEAPSLNPVPRTTHTISNTVLEEGASAKSMKLNSAWTCHVYFLRNRTQHVFFGRRTDELVSTDEGWRIQCKKVVLMNDYVPAIIDVFCV